VLIKTNNPAAVIVISNYISTKYKNYKEIKKMSIDQNGSEINVEFTKKSENFEVEKDFLISIKQIATDNNLSISVSY